ncbi:MAG: cupin domain-containing protein [Candidatus Limnocylindria bacterium]
MTHPARLMASASILVLVAAACGAAVTPAATAAPTAAPTIAATVAPTPTRPVVAATGQGAASVKLAENRVVLADGAPPNLAPGNYLSTVSLVSLERGGRTVAHKHGGIESIYVLDGTVDFRSAGGTRLILTRGQGAAVPPDTILQAVNGGDGIAKFLAFFLTPEAAPFQTNVNEAP